MSPEITTLNALENSIVDWHKNPELPQKRFAAEINGRKIDIILLKGKTSMIGNKPASTNRTMNVAGADECVQKILKLYFPCTKIISDEPALRYSRKSAIATFEIRFYSNSHLMETQIASDEALGSYEESVKSSKKGCSLL